MKLSRRNLLRGASGLTLALPWLEAFAQTATVPRRLVTCFTANGDQITQRFTTKGETNWVFGDMLSPFEPYRSQLLVLDKVHKYHNLLPSGRVADGHEQGGSALAPWQSGAGSFPIGGTSDFIGYVEGPSLDRAIGDRQYTDFKLPQRHLNFRVGDQSNNIWNTHSHQGPVGTQAPIPPETSPFTAYTRLFANIDTSAQQNLARQLAMKRSALDLLKGELSSLQSKVGASDKARLEQHAQSLRDIERQLDSTGNVPACGTLTLGASLDVYKADNYLDVGKLFFKIIAMSFACRLVNIAAFNWSGNTSDRVYKSLNLTEGHHTISHDSSDAAFVKIRAIKKHLFQCSTLLHDELKALPEAGGTVWDNSLVMHWSELSQGDTHQKDQDLVILAGGAGKYFRMGRMLDLAGRPKRALSNLLVSMWQYMGYPEMTTWGDPLLMPDGAGPMPNLT